MHEESTKPSRITRVKPVSKSSTKLSKPVKEQKTESVSTSKQRNDQS